MRKMSSLREGRKRRGKGEGEKRGNKRRMREGERRRGEVKGTRWEEEKGAASHSSWCVLCGDQIPPKRVSLE